MPQLMITTIQVLAVSDQHVGDDPAVSIRQWMRDELKTFSELYDEGGSPSMERLAEEAALHFELHEPDGAIPGHVWAAAAAVTGDDR